MSPEKGTDELVVSMLTTSKTTVHSNTAVPSRALGCCWLYGEETRLSVTGL